MATNEALGQPAGAETKAGPGSLVLMDVWVEGENEADAGAGRCEVH